jgi:DNA polymerase-3 subunit epsilon
MSNFGGHILDQPLVFVDIETNGLNYQRGKVIEVAAIRTENGKIVNKFHTLLDPQTELPQFISNLTGITTHELKKAPTFGQIADELNEILAGAIFVAHNVRFDYSFLKQEFKRQGRNFLPKQLCTVKLSRTLYPHVKGHKLEDVINRHGFKFSQRHRAYDDAQVLWQFIQHVGKHFPPEQIEAAIAKQIRSPAIPKNLHPELIRGLPEAPGVYIFEDSSGCPLYVGKSINIKKRVLSHFGRDHAESREFKISQTIHNIRTIETTGELTALLLESQLVKELQPVYNRKLRRTKKLLLAKQESNETGYITVHLKEASHINPEEAGSILAVYERRSRAREVLDDLAKTFDLCPKLLGLENSGGSCFWYQLKKCRGACCQEEDAESYNQRLLSAFERQRIHSWPYKNAILLQELTNLETTHAIIIDQWCVLGEIIQEPYCEPTVKLTEKAFDLDTYKILQSHLSNKLKQLSVTLLSPTQLIELGI